MREGSKIKRKKTLERVNLNIKRKTRNLCLNCLGRTSKVHYEEEERISVRYLINRYPQFYVLSNQDLYLQFLLYKSLVPLSCGPCFWLFCDDQTYCMCNCVWYQVFSFFLFLYTLYDINFKISYVGVILKKKKICWCHLILHRGLPTCWVEFIMLKFAFS